jgi:hypothetical protein
VYYIDTTGSDDYLDKLEEFCTAQDPTISRSGYNSRSESKNWSYMEDNSWNGWDNCKDLKIAYRGGC